MSGQAAVTANFWNESSGSCDCCGNQSRRIWGDLSDDAGARAVYFVHWTEERPEHYPAIDLVIGAWGDGTSASGRFLVSLSYRPAPGGGSLMVIDAQGRSADDRSLCARALRRAEVIGRPLAAEVFALVDALWLTEPRMAGVLALDALAPGN